MQISTEAFLYIFLFWNELIFTPFLILIFYFLFSLIENEFIISFAEYDKKKVDLLV